MSSKAAIMTAQELAGYLRVHPMTVYRLIQRGNLPALRVGRVLRFRKDQIDRWLARNEINGQSPGSERAPYVAKGRRRERRA